MGQTNSTFIGRGVVRRFVSQDKSVVQKDSITWIDNIEIS